LSEGNGVNCGKIIRAYIHNALPLEFVATYVFYLFSVLHCVSNVDRSEHEFNCNPDINIDRDRDFYGSYFCNATINLQPAEFPFIMLQVA
jgi:hypothetical protein